jgi:hypothetical protein
MFNLMRKKQNVAVIMLFVICTGCATNITKPSGPPMPPTTKFSAFTRVELKAASLSERFAESEVNQKAAQNLTEKLAKELQIVFPSLKQVPTFSKGNERVLQIDPLIKDIKFIGIGARVWSGAMSGSSAILMQAFYRDSTTGEVVANPEFYAVGGAYSGFDSAYRMLQDIANEVAKYSAINR